MVRVVWKVDWGDGWVLNRRMGLLAAENMAPVVVGGGGGRSAGILEV